MADTTRMGADDPLPSDLPQAQEGRAPGTDKALDDDFFPMLPIESFPGLLPIEDGGVGESELLAFSSPGREALGQIGKIAASTAPSAPAVLVDPADTEVTEAGAQQEAENHVDREQHQEPAVRELHNDLNQCCNDLFPSLPIDEAEGILHVYVEDDPSVVVKTGTAAVPAWSGDGLPLPPARGNSQSHGDRSPGRDHVADRPSSAPVDPVAQDRIAGDDAEENDEEDEFSPTFPSLPFPEDLPSHRPDVHVVEVVQPADAQLGVADVRLPDHPAVQLHGAPMPAVQLPAAPMPAVQLPAAPMPDLSIADGPALELSITDGPILDLSITDGPVLELSTADVPAALPDDKKQNDEALGDANSNAPSLSSAPGSTTLPSEDAGIKAAASVELEPKGTEDQDEVCYPTLPLDDLEVLPVHLQSPPYVDDAPTSRAINKSSTTYEEIPFIVSSELQELAGRGCGEEDDDDDPTEKTPYPDSLGCDMAFFPSLPIEGRPSDVPLPEASKWVSLKIEEGSDDDDDHAVAKKLHTATSHACCEVTSQPAASPLSSASGTMCPSQAASTAEKDKEIALEQEAESVGKEGSDAEARDSDSGGRLKLSLDAVSENKTERTVIKSASSPLGQQQHHLTSAEIIPGEVAEERESKTNVDPDVAVNSSADPESETKADDTTLRDATSTTAGSSSSSSTAENEADTRNAEVEAAMAAEGAKAEILDPEDESNHVDHEQEAGAPKPATKEGTASSKSTPEVQAENKGAEEMDAAMKLEGVESNLNSSLSSQTKSTSHTTEAAHGDETRKSQTFLSYKIPSHAARDASATPCAGGKGSRGKGAGKFCMIDKPRGKACLVDPARRTAYLMDKNTGCCVGRGLIKGDVKSGEAVVRFGFEVIPRRKAASRSNSRAKAAAAGSARPEKAPRDASISSSSVSSSRREQSASPTREARVLLLKGAGDGTSAPATTSSPAPAGAARAASASSNGSKSNKGGTKRGQRGGSNMQRRARAKAAALAKASLAHPKAKEEVATIAAASTTSTAMDETKGQGRRESSTTSSDSGVILTRSSSSGSSSLSACSGRARSSRLIPRSRLVPSPATPADAGAAGGGGGGGRRAPANGRGARVQPERAERGNSIEPGVEGRFVHPPRRGRSKPKALIDAENKQKEKEVKRKEKKLTKFMNEELQARMRKQLVMQVYHEELNDAFEAKAAENKRMMEERVKQAPAEVNNEERKVEESSDAPGQLQLELEEDAGLDFAEKVVSRDAIRKAEKKAERHEEKKRRKAEKLKQLQEAEGGSAAAQMKTVGGAGGAVTDISKPPAASEPVATELETADGGTHTDSRTSEIMPLPLLRSNSSPSIVGEEESSSSSRSSSSSCASTAGSSSAAPISAQRQQQHHNAKLNEPAPAPASVLLTKERKASKERERKLSKERGEKSPSVTINAYPDEKFITPIGTKNYTRCQEARRGRARAKSKSATTPKKKKSTSPRRKILAALEEASERKVGDAEEMESEKETITMSEVEADSASETESDVESSGASSRGQSINKSAPAESTQDISESAQMDGDEVFGTPRSTAAPSTISTRSNTFDASPLLLLEKLLAPVPPRALLFQEDDVDAENGTTEERTTSGPAASVTAAGSRWMKKSPDPGSSGRKKSRSRTTSIDKNRNCKKKKKKTSSAPLPTPEVQPSPPRHRPPRKKLEQQVDDRASVLLGLIAELEVEDQRLCTGQNRLRDVLLDHGEFFKLCKKAWHEEASLPELWTRRKGKGKGKDTDEENEQKGRRKDKKEKRKSRSRSASRSPTIANSESENSVAETEVVKRQKTAAEKMEIEERGRFETVQNLRRALNLILETVFEGLDLDDLFLIEEDEHHFQMIEGNPTRIDAATGKMQGERIVGGSAKSGPDMPIVATLWPGWALNCKSLYEFMGCVKKFLESVHRNLQKETDMLFGDGDGMAADDGVELEIDEDEEEEEEIEDESLEHDRRQVERESKEKEKEDTAVAAAKAEREKAAAAKAAEEAEAAAAAAAAKKAARDAIAKEMKEKVLAKLREDKDKEEMQKQVVGKGAGGGG